MYKDGGKFTCNLFPETETFFSMRIRGNIALEKNKKMLLSKQLMNMHFIKPEETLFIPDAESVADKPIRVIGP